MLWEKVRVQVKGKRGSRVYLGRIEVLVGGVCVCVCVCCVDVRGLTSAALRWWLGSSVGTAGIRSVAVGSAVCLDRSGHRAT